MLGRKFDFCLSLVYSKSIKAPSRQKFVKCLRTGLIKTKSLLMFNSRILNYVTHRIVTLTEFEKRLSGFFLSAIFYVNFWQKKSITINHEMQHKVNFLVCLLQNTSLSSHFCVTHKLLPVSTHSLIGGEFTLCVDEKQYICILNVG